MNCGFATGANVSFADVTALVSEPFVTTKATGLGVGLALCRSIVEAHRGRVRAANNPHGGATITIEWPARPSNVPAQGRAPALHAVAA